MASDNDPHAGSAASPQRDGAMREEYALARENSPPLIYRYKVRAMAAVHAYRRRHPKTPPDQVLELGAADGRTLIEIRRLFRGCGQYHGIELSQELLAHAPTGCDEVEFVLGDATRLPTAVTSHRYSLVTALALLEHLEDPAGCLSQAIRVLKPGGVMVATCPNPSWDNAAGKAGLVRDEHHLQKMDRERMQHLFREAGFREVLFEPFMWLPTALLPYARIPVSPSLALGIDAFVRRFGRLTHGTFINQLVSGIK